MEEHCELAALIVQCLDPIKWHLIQNTSFWKFETVTMIAFQ